MDVLYNDLRHSLFSTPSTLKREGPLILDRLHYVHVFIYLAFRLILFSIPITIITSKFTYILCKYLSFVMYQMNVQLIIS